MASHTRLVMNTVIRTYLRSLTQIENGGTKREQFVAIYSHYESISFVFAFFMNRLSAQWSKSGDAAIKEHLKALSAFGLIIYALTMTFASIDWMMSLEPFWDSSIYGLMVIFGQLLTSLSFSIFILNLMPGLGLGRNWSLRTTPTPFKDLGALMLTFIMGWAYLAYFQLLIIWAADIPHEVVWYTNRIQGGWLTVGVLVAVLQFVLPFGMLITRRVRSNMRLLAALGGTIVLVYLVNLYWQIIPAFYPGQFNLSLTDIGLPIGLGGLWVGAFMVALKRRPALREVEQASLEPKQPEPEHAVT